MIAMFIYHGVYIVFQGTLVLKCIRAHNASLKYIISTDALNWYYTILGVLF